MEPLNRSGGSEFQPLVHPAREVNQNGHINQRAAAEAGLEEAFDKEDW